MDGRGRRCRRRAESDFRFARGRCGEPCSLADPSAGRLDRQTMRTSDGTGSGPNGSVHQRTCYAHGSAQVEGHLRGMIVRRLPGNSMDRSIHRGG